METHAIAKEFDRPVGDKRRARRLKKVAEAFARHPEQSFPSFAGDEAAVEAAYRLLRNENLSYTNVSEGHTSCTSARCREFGTVVAIHDWTEFSWETRDGYLRENLSALSPKRQGFFGHYSFAASADGLRVPLGTIALRGYVHRRQADETTWEFWSKEFGELETEGLHWTRQMEVAERRLEACSVIHVCDREADRVGVLRWLTERESRFVIRCRQGKTATVGKVLAKQLRAVPVSARRIVDLNGRSLQGLPARSKTQPARSRRRATLSFRAMAATLTPTQGGPIQVNLVEAFEEVPPSGQAPVHWVLATSEPIETTDDILRVVDLYRTRWLIEEFFKVIKTGCAFSKRQLASAHTLLIALALSNAIAWHLLTLRHLERASAGMAASCLVNQVQLALLKHEAPKVAWAKVPTLDNVMKALASIGGHHRTNGDPGWMILGRAYQRLLDWELGARMAVKLGLT